ncbi:ArsR/SmtB family transcription factor [Roseinatronobacter alkalisoli]|uniref:Metalloregulator ArsR/SmtB family transcription factor n=1 Tax=Roseinatronobacter alkalisoli TaxID=3028235 RepID=A0ABT5TA71_9RHOB|nr:metalloregulator ArsR/SmtB family transcription factor [Roseinatronobacter sp. HJB301]MDD7970833.1 metalloregulator ArsR/SmtB family transcription factor [Roseinatronobacter sp. HJB301]
MSTEDKYDALFKALGHRVRRQMLDLLKDGPQTTGALCDALPACDRCTVMQHLTVLEKAGLLVVERRGRERWNHLDALPIHDIQQRWIGPYADHAVSMLAQLKRTVEDEPDPVAQPPASYAPAKS